MVYKVHIKPPYFAPGWLDSFFDLARRVRLEKVDRHLFARYQICSAANGSKMVSGLKFLKLIDENGNIIQENLKGLKLEGESSKEEFKRIVSEAYSDLASQVDLLNAKKEDLINYFIGHLNYSPLQAQLATRMFLYLARKSGMELSEELNKSTKSSKKGRPIGFKSKNMRYEQPINKSKATKNLEVSSIQGGDIISIHVMGKGITLDLNINSIEEIKPNLEIISQILTLNLKKKNNSQEK